MNRIIRIDPKLKEVELRHKPRIVRVNSFDEESATLFIKEISMAHNTGQSFIPVVIDSYGGEVYSLLAMISAIKNSSLPVATVVEGKAMSCGVVLFSCGQKGMRYIAEESTLMIHDVSDWVHGKNAEIQASAKESKRLNKLLYEILSDNCGKKKDYFWNEVQKRGRADWYITPKNAVRLNLADYIGLPTLHVDIKVDISLK
jgi:ATP-dependent Clp protease, protease subunit